MTHAVVGKQETRKLKEIVEIINVDNDGNAITNTAFVWNPRDDNFYFKKDLEVFKKIGKKYGLTVNELKKDFELRTKLLNELQRRNILDYNQIQKIINEYHKNPEAVLKAFGIGAS